MCTMADDFIWCHPAARARIKALTEALGLVLTTLDSQFPTERPKEPTRRYP
jgi:hypothetical protein